MQKVMLEEAKAKLELLFEAAINGETVLIEQEGSIVQLTLLSQPKKPRQAGNAAGLITIADDFDDPLEDFAEYME